MDQFGNPLTPPAPGGQAAAPAGSPFPGVPFTPANPHGFSPTGALAGFLASRAQGFEAPPTAQATHEAKTPPPDEDSLARSHGADGPTSLPQSIESQELRQSFGLTNANAESLPTGAEGLIGELDDALANTPKPRFTSAEQKMIDDAIAESVRKAEEYVGFVEQASDFAKAHGMGNLNGRWGQENSFNRRTADVLSGRVNPQSVWQDKNLLRLMQADARGKPPGQSMMSQLMRAWNKRQFARSPEEEAEALASARKYLSGPVPEGTIKGTKLSRERTDEKRRKFNEERGLQPGDRGYKQTSDEYRASRAAKREARLAELNTISGITRQARSPAHARSLLRRANERRADKNMPPLTPNGPMLSPGVLDAKQEDISFENYAPGQKIKLDGHDTSFITSGPFGIVGGAVAAEVGGGVFQIIQTETGELGMQPMVENGLNLWVPDVKKIERGEWARNLDPTAEADVMNRITELAPHSTAAKATVKRLSELDAQMHEINSDPAISKEEAAGLREEVMLLKREAMYDFMQTPDSQKQLPSDTDTIFSKDGIPMMYDDKGRLVMNPDVPYLDQITGRFYMQGGEVIAERDPDNPEEWVRVEEADRKRAEQERADEIKREDELREQEQQHDLEKEERTAGRKAEADEAKQAQARSVAEASSGVEKASQARNTATDALETRKKAFDESTENIVDAVSNTTAIGQTANAIFTEAVAAENARRASLAEPLPPLNIDTSQISEDIIGTAQDAVKYLSAIRAAIASARDADFADLTAELEAADAAVAEAEQGLMDVKTPAAGGDPSDPGAAPEASGQPPAPPAGRSEPVDPKTELANNPEGAAELTEAMNDTGETVDIPLYGPDDPPVAVPAAALEAAMRLFNVDEENAKAILIEHFWNGE